MERSEQEAKKRHMDVDKAPQIHAEPKQTRAKPRSTKCIASIYNIAYTAVSDPSYPPKHPCNQKPTTPNKAHSRQSSNRIQHNSHINRAALILHNKLIILPRLRILTKLLNTPYIQHDRRKRQIAENPREHHRAAEAFVVIFVLRLVVDDLFGGNPFGGESADFRLVLGIEIRVVGGNGDVDFAAGFQIRGWQFLRRVVAFGAPGDVVGVAEGVDVEDVDVGGGEEEVLDEGGEHVPGVEEEEGGDEVEEPGGGHGDDEGEEDFVGEEEGDGEVGVQRELGLDGFDGDEDGGEEEVAGVLLVETEDWGRIITHHISTAQK